MRSSAPLLEQRAQVTQVAADRLTLIPLAGLGCERCAAGHGCGGALFGRSKADAPVELVVSNTPALSLGDVQVGDVVVLGVSAPSLQRLVLWSYGMPLLMMVLAVLIAAQWQLSEPAQAGVALLAMLGSAMWLRHHLRARSAAPICHLLHREPAAGSACLPS